MNRSLDTYKIKEAIFAYNKIKIATHIDNLVDFENRGGCFLPPHYSRPPQSHFNETIIIAKHKLMVFFAKKNFLHAKYCNSSFHQLEPIIKRYEEIIDKIDTRTLTRAELKKYFQLN